jgi:hypothetical protein
MAFKCPTCKADLKPDYKAGLLWNHLMRLREAGHGAEMLGSRAIMHLDAHREIVTEAEARYLKNNAASKTPS